MGYLSWITENRTVTSYSATMKCRVSIEIL